jgi:transcriptional regulator with XRE-family HTH domain
VTLADAVADEVERRMLAHGLSQNALARAAGMPPTLLHRALNRERELRLHEIEWLADAFGIDVEWLLSAALTHTPRSGDCSESNGNSGSD